MNLTPEQQVLKDAFIRARGYWRPWTEGLLRLDPEFTISNFQALIRLADKKDAERLDAALRKAGLPD